MSELVANPKNVNPEYRITVQTDFRVKKLEKTRIFVARFQGQQKLERLHSQLKLLKAQQTAHSRKFNEKLTEQTANLLNPNNLEEVQWLRLQSLIQLLIVAQMNS
jgi:hypothetical protein